MSQTKENRVKLAAEKYKRATEGYKRDTEEYRAVVLDYIADCVTRAVGSDADHIVEVADQITSQLLAINQVRYRLRSRSCPCFPASKR